MNLHFKAKTGNNLLHESASYFDNSVNGAVLELAQNARRAGATRIKCKWANNVLEFEDNGPGCDPEDLFDFGGSNWDKEMVAAETPAGIGFWALARAQTAIYCGRGWSTEVRREHFTGDEYIDVLECAGQKGVGLCVSCRGLTGRLSPDLFRYFPFEHVLFNDKPVRTGEEFISSSDTVHDMLDGRVKARVMLMWEHVMWPAGWTGYPSQNGRGFSNYTFCYHGYTISEADDALAPAYKNMGGVDKKGTLWLCSGVRVDVLVGKESALPLTLPQRTSLVRGEEWSRFIDEARCTVARLVAEHLQQNNWRLYCSPARALEQRKYFPAQPWPELAGMRVWPAFRSIQEKGVTASLGWVGEFLSWENAHVTQADTLSLRRVDISGYDMRTCICLDAALCNPIDIVVCPWLGERLREDMFPDHIVSGLEHLERRQAVDAEVCSTGGTLVSASRDEYNSGECLVSSADVHQALTLEATRSKTDYVCPLTCFLPVYTLVYAVRQQLTAILQGVPLYATPGAVEKGWPERVTVARTLLDDLIEENADSDEDQGDWENLLGKFDTGVMLLTDPEDYAVRVLSRIVRQALDRFPARLWNKYASVTVTGWETSVKVKLNPKENA